jgi:hypothetical protein
MAHPQLDSLMGGAWKVKVEEEEEEEEEEGRPQRTARTGWAI